MMMTSSAVSAQRRSGLCTATLASPDEYCRQLAHIEELALKTVHNSALHIISAQRQAAQAAFRGIVGQADAAILGEAGKAGPAVRHVVDRLEHAGGAREFVALRP